MDTSSVIAQIDLEISRLQQARELLTGTLIKKGPGRPKAAESDLEVKVAGTPGRKPFSPEAKEKMAAAQRKRWAKVKRDAKKSAKVAASMS